MAEPIRALDLPPARPRSTRRPMTRRWPAAPSGRWAMSSAYPVWGEPDGAGTGLVIRRTATGTRARTSSSMRWKARSRWSTIRASTCLTPGMCAGFKAGVPNGHKLINRSAAPAIYLEIGTRAEGDRAHYADADMLAVKENGKYRLTHKDGTPY